MSVLAKQTEQLFDSVGTGLEILRKYPCDLKFFVVPNSYDNGTAKSSHQIAITVTIGEEEPAQHILVALSMMGWVFDYPHITLYVPNMYALPTQAEAFLLAKNF